MYVHTIRETRGTLSAWVSGTVIVLSFSALHVCKGHTSQVNQKFYEA
jgi:hypothetical protein